MLRTETVEHNTLELLKDLMSKEYLKDFVLVGGTALALQMGQRKSIDLDLFTNKEFNAQELLVNLKNDFNIQTLTLLNQTLISNIDSIKVDFIHFSYPFIRPVKNIDNVRLLDIEDIAPMKLDAITGRGSKKDFYDLYFLLSIIPLKKMIELYKEKYPHQTTFHVIRSLGYFDDAELQPDPIVFDKKVTWDKVKTKIINEIKKHI